MSLSKGADSMDTLEQIFEAILTAVRGAHEATKADYALAGPA